MVMKRNPRMAQLNSPQMRAALYYSRKRRIARQSSEETPADGVILPEGVPEPLVWFTPRHVEVDGSGDITKILNQGSTGATNDATPDTANLAKISNLAGWNDQDVFDIPSTSSGGYGLGNVAEARTILTVATYKDGIDATFDGYDGLFSGGVGTSIELIGTNASANTFNTGSDIVVNGIETGVGSTAVLPADKKGLGSTNDGTFSAAGVIWRDDFGTTRNWKGLCGDIMMFETHLSASDILAVHNAINDFYS